MPIEGVAEEERHTEHEDDQARVLKPASADRFDVHWRRCQRGRRDVGRRRALGDDRERRRRNAIGLFVRRGPGRRWTDWRRPNGQCLEPLDPIGQATNLSLELEGANESDDGDEDPEKNDQRSQNPEHRVLDEMLARKQSGASLYGPRNVIRQ